jgi:hypothetical protein
MIPLVKSLAKYTKRCTHCQAGESPFGLVKSWGRRKLNLLRYNKETRSAAAPRVSYYNLHLDYFKNIIFFSEVNLLATIR